jgi:hypothetical protein
MNTVKKIDLNIHDLGVTRIDYQPSCTVTTSLATESTISVEVYERYSESKTTAQILKTALRNLYEKNRGYKKVYVAKGTVLDLRTLLQNGDVLELDYGAGRRLQIQTLCLYSQRRQCCDYFRLGIRLING